MQWCVHRNIADVQVDGKYYCCALLDTRCQVNTITPSYTKEQKMNIFPLKELKDGPDEDHM